MIQIYIFHGDDETGRDRQKMAEATEKKIIGYLGERYAVDPAAVHIRKTDRGMPYIEGIPDLYISRSYCSGYAVYALGQIPVGIDIEEVRPYNRFLAVQFYSPSELQNLTSEKWTRLWTVKEAYAKYRETGLSCLRNFDLPIEELVENEGLKMKDIRIDRKHICSLVAETDTITTTYDTFV